MINCLTGITPVTGGDGKLFLVFDFLVYGKDHELILFTHSTDSRIFCSDFIWYVKYSKNDRCLSPGSACLPVNSS